MPRCRCLRGVQHGHNSQTMGLTDGVLGRWVEKAAGPVQCDADLQPAYLQDAQPRTDKHKCADDRKDPETEKSLQ
jgi:hypothetical protein